MARAIICDHCGKAVSLREARHLAFYPFTKNGEWLGSRPDAHADLCPGCYIEFKNMLGLELRVEVNENAEQTHS